MNKQVHLLQPERADGETQSQYRERRASGQAYAKATLNGTMFWNPAAQGTYTTDQRHRPGKAIKRAMRRMA